MVAGADLCARSKYQFLKLLRMPGYAIPSIAFPAMFYLLFGVMFGRGIVGGLSMQTYLIATYGAFGVIGRRSSASAWVWPSNVARAG